MTDVASASFVGRPVHWLRYGRSFLAVRLNQRSSRLRSARPQRRSNGPEAGAQIDDHRIGPAAGAGPVVDGLASRAVHGVWSSKANMSAGAVLHAQLRDQSCPQVRGRLSISGLRFG